MQLRWVLVGLLLSLSVGVLGIVLKRFYLNYSIGDILAITGLMLFTTAVVSLLLARLGFAVKRCVARSRWAELLGVMTLHSGTQVVRQPQDASLLPPGTVVCVVPPSLPVFCPDNAGDMLTIFEDYAQYPPQPRRLFDTHRVSPATSPEPRAQALVCLPDEPFLYLVDASGSFVPLASPQTSAEPPEAPALPYVQDPPPPYSELCGDPPPPYSDVPPMLGEAA
ncbi:unnamed protein product [Ixodes hexagonus]